MLSSVSAVSVAVSAWTLVAMSVERYYAICYPLRSRRWQTKSHAKKMICVVWIGSLLVMMPIATLSRLMALKDEGKFKCREMWPDLISEQAFTVMLDFLLLVVPLFIMIGTYCKIVQTLRNAMKSTPVVNDSVVTNKVNGSPYNNCNRNYVFRGVARPPTTCTAEQRFDFMRRTNADKALQQKKRIIVMLIVVVMEFFICWSPLYAINTISMFAPKVVYDGLGYTGLSLIQLLAHTSSISNPITYCFLNTKFRQSFISVICCWARKRRPLYSMSESTPTLKHNASKPPTARQLSHL
ncbi:CCKAR (predicted) [Pycnogonum litorale]